MKCSNQICGYRVGEQCTDQNVVFGIHGCSSREVPNMTNADRIRSMSDEELVKHLECNCCVYQNLPGCSINFSEDNCERGILEWVKQEAEHEKD
jgi:hypothetical protein